MDDKQGQYLIITSADHRDGEDWGRTQYREEIEFLFNHINFRMLIRYLIAGIRQGTEEITS